MFPQTLQAFGECGRILCDEGLHIAFLRRHVARDHAGEHRLERRPRASELRVVYEGHRESGGQVVAQHELA